MYKLSKKQINLDYLDILKCITSKIFFKKNGQTSQNISAFLSTDPSTNTLQLQEIVSCRVLQYEKVKDLIIT